MVARNDLKQCYLEFHQQLVGLLFHYTGDVETAEDIVQDVFIKLSRRSEGLQFENKKAMRGWLYRVAVNLALDKKRKLKRMFSFLNFEASTVEERTPGGVKQLELSDEIKEILSPLSEKERMVIILKFMQEMDYQEISEVMGIKVGTLKSTVSRALQKIKKG